MFAFDRQTHFFKHWFLYGILFSILFAFLFPELGSNEGDYEHENDIDRETTQSTNGHCCLSRSIQTGMDSEIIRNDAHFSSQWLCHTKRSKPLVN
jgi:hypothetical protein